MLRSPQQRRMQAQSLPDLGLALAQFGGFQPPLRSLYRIVLSLAYFAGTAGQSSHQFPLFPRLAFDPGEIESH